MSDVEQKDFPDTDYRERINSLIEKRNEELLEEREVKEVVKLYEPAFDESKSFWERLLAFLRAENRLGREVGKYLDEYASEEINDAREYVKKHILPRL